MLNAEWRMQSCAEAIARIAVFRVAVWCHNLANLSPLRARHSGRATFARPMPPWATIWRPGAPGLNHRRDACATRALPLVQRNVMIRHRQDRRVDGGGVEVADF